MADIHFENAPLGSGYVTTSGYGYRGDGEFHDAIDLGFNGNPDGTKPVYATAAGKVSYIRTVSADGDSSYGNAIKIDHGNGVFTLYAHLAGEPNFKVGDTVPAGAILGMMGNTGESDGPHLHYEIQVNGSNIDPAEYIKGSTVLSSDYTPTSTVDDSVREGSTVIGQSGGTTVAQRVSGVTINPTHAFVNIWVGDKLLATDPPRPNITQWFEFKRLDFGSGECTFSLFDDNWEEIELALLGNPHDIWIEYGYPGTGVRSKLIKQELQDYSAVFESTGVILNVRTQAPGIFLNSAPRNIVTETRNPTKAVKDICTNLGLVVLDENFDSSSDIHSINPFNLIEEFPITYILRTIIPQASLENEELFNFWIDEENKAYFKRSHFSNKTDSYRTYVYQKGYDSSVISFEVLTNTTYGGVGEFNAATGYKISVIDTESKEETYHEADILDSADIVTGDHTSMSPAKSRLVTGLSASTPNQAKSILRYRLNSKSIPYSAKMTIVGDPTLDILIDDHYIRVINITDKGTMHHTSGLYEIKEAQDTVGADGTMTTSLDLVRFAVFEGEIELINPKYLMK